MNKFFENLENRKGLSPKDKETLKKYTVNKPKTDNKKKKIPWWTIFVVCLEAALLVGQVKFEDL